MATGSHHAPFSQSSGVTPEGRHTLATGSHHEPLSQSARLIAGVAIAVYAIGANAAVTTTATRRPILFINGPFRGNCPSFASCDYFVCNRALNALNRLACRLLLPQSGPSPARYRRDLQSTPLRYRTLQSSTLSRQALYCRWLRGRKSCSASCHVIGVLSFWPMAPATDCG